MTKYMKFEIGQFYVDRVGGTWECIKPVFGSLPTLRNDEGKTIVQNVTGKYRFDDLEHDRDIIGVTE